MLGLLRHLRFRRQIELNIKNWETSPTSVLTHAFEITLRLKPNRSILKKYRQGKSTTTLLMQLGEQRVFSELIDAFDLHRNRFCQSDLEEIIRLLREAKLTLHNAAERRELGLEEVDFESGDDLTNVIESAERTEEFRIKVSDFIGARLLDKSIYTQEAVKGLRSAAGASKHFNNLFTDEAFRKRTPEKWADVSALLRAMTEARTRFNTVVWHGFSLKSSEVYRLRNSRCLPSQHGFFHTSLSSHQALKHVYGSPTPVLACVFLRKGSPALYRSGHPYEHEILLPPNTTFEIVGSQSVKRSDRLGDEINVLVLHLSPRFDVPPFTNVPLASVP